MYAVHYYLPSFLESTIFLNLTDEMGARPSGKSCMSSEPLSAIEILAVTDL